MFFCRYNEKQLFRLTKVYFTFSFFPQTKKYLESLNLLKRFSAQSEQLYIRSVGGFRWTNFWTMNKKSSELKPDILWFPGLIFLSQAPSIQVFTPALAYPGRGVTRGARDGRGAVPLKGANKVSPPGSLKMPQITGNFPPQTNLGKNKTWNTDLKCRLAIDIKKWDWIFSLFINKMDI